MNKKEVSEIKNFYPGRLCDYPDLRLLRGRGEEQADGA